MKINTKELNKSVIAKSINVIGLGIVISIGMAMVTTASAHSGGYVSDGSGNPIRDGSGNCILADGGNSFPECEPTVEAAGPIAAPVIPKPVVVVPPPKPVKVAVIPPKPAVKAPPKPQPRYITKTLSLKESSGANFGFDKDNLTSNAQQQLSRFASAVRNSNVTPSSVSIIGHTDSTGPERYNQSLSEKRANSVASYLSSQGFDRRVMQVSGRGESQAVASNKTRDGRAQNRRVDIRVNGQRKITVKQ